MAELARRDLLQQTDHFMETKPQEIIRFLHADVLFDNSREQGQQQVHKDCQVSSSESRTSSLVESELCSLA